MVVEQKFKMNTPEKRFTNFITTICVTIALRAADLYVTYLVTPDLRLEANPLVVSLHLTWPQLIVVQTLLVGIAASCSLLFYRRRLIHVAKSGLNLPKFVFFYFNGESAHFRNAITSFFSLPKSHNFHAHLGFIGFIIMMSVILGSVFAILHNLAILWEVSPYIEFVMHNRYYYFIFSFFVITFFSANIFFIYEYTRYKRDHGTAPNLE